MSTNEEQVPGAAEEPQGEGAAVATLEPGFKYESDTTSAGKKEYPIEYMQAETEQAWRDWFAKRGLNVADTIRDLLNELQTQRATQGGKQAVRDAKTDAERDKAIAAHQANARKYLLAGARKRVGKGPAGVTKAQSADFGAAMIGKAMELGRALSDVEMWGLALECGLDPAKLFGDRAAQVQADFSATQAQAQEPAAV